MPSYFILCCVLFFSLVLPVCGQVPDSVSLAAGKTSIDISSEMIHTHSPLYNGSEYVNYDNHIEGHQFFESQVLEEGAVVYNGILYENVPMLYDIVKDEVIIEHFNQYYKIRLVSENVKEFTLLTHTFVRYEPDTASATTIPAGFYEILYNGQVKVLAKKGKRYKETIDSQRVIRKFLPAHQYYLYKDKVFYPLKGKSSVVQVFASHKKQIRQFIKQNHLTFKATIEQDLASISRFYDKLQSE